MTTSVRTVNTEAEIEELDWDVPTVQFNEYDPYNIQNIVKHFERHNKVVVQGEALEYLTELAEDDYFCWTGVRKHGVTQIWFAETLLALDWNVWNIDFYRNNFNYPSDPDQMLQNLTEAFESWNAVELCNNATEFFHKTAPVYYTKQAGGNWKNEAYEQFGWGCDINEVEDRIEQVEKAMKERKEA